jgi:peroxiredoxin family protein
VIAQQLSEQSSETPLSNSFVTRNVDIDKVKVINERSKQRVKRLRNFASKGNVHVYACVYVYINTYTCHWIE